jgi:MYXO-CTERM domain-containing protein
MKKILLPALALSGAALVPFTNAIARSQDVALTGISSKVESTADDPAALALLGLCILWAGIRIGRDRK